MGSFSLGHQVMSVESKRREGETQNDQIPAIHLSQSDITLEEKRELEKFLYDFRSLFAVENGPLGRTSAVKHSIKTRGPPIRGPFRRIPHSLQGTVATEIQKMLKQDVIRKSKSPWSSIIMVRKRDGSWKFCIDFWKLNEVTHKDAYPYHASTKPSRPYRVHSCSQL